MLHIRKVKKPRKIFRCYLCQKVLEEHLYISIVQDGDFHTMRVHGECFHKLNKLCSDCIYRDDCTFDMGECYSDKYQGGVV